MKEGVEVPVVIFKTRIRDESIDGDNPFRWEEVSSTNLFAGRRTIVFSLPGAFTPTCSTYQLPGFEANYAKIQTLGIDEVYVASVNSQDLPNLKSGAKKKNLKSINTFGGSVKTSFKDIEALVSGNTLTRELTITPPNQLTPTIYRQKIIWGKKL